VLPEDITLESINSIIHQIKQKSPGLLILPMASKPYSPLILTTNIPLREIP